MLLPFLLACTPASWVRVDVAGYAPGEDVGLLVVSEGRAPVPSVDGEDATCDEPRALGDDLEVRRCDAGALAEGDHVANAKGADDVTVHVGDDAADTVLATGLQFFDAQGCGPGDHALHGACHLYASVIDGDGATFSGDGVLADGTPVDVEGGWHDAGDYVKFAHTTAFAVVMLLDAYLADPDAWGDADVLAAAEPGVRWLSRLPVNDATFVYQVSDERDHDAWRLPEDDTATPLPGMEQRPAYVCGDACANVAGRTAAALALAARAYADADPDLAVDADAAARRAYAFARAHPGVQPTEPADFYPEDTWADDTALAALALYAIDADPAELADARADLADADALTTPSYADVGLLAEAWIAAAAGDDEGLAARRDAWRAAFADDVAADPTGWAGEGEWGSVAIAAGAATACARLAAIDGDDACAADARWQVHAARGANPFGAPYMVGLPGGPTAIASPLPDLTGEPETGAVVGGPASAATIADGGVVLENGEDRFEGLQTAGMQFHDDPGDYVTNEAALDYTAHLLVATAAWR